MTKQQRARAMRQLLSLRASIERVQAELNDCDAISDVTTAVADDQLDTVLMTIGLEIKDIDDRDEK